MAKINGISFPGITLEKDYKGNVLSVNINMKRCSAEMKSYLKEIGLIKDEPLYDPKFVAKILKRKNEKNIPINIDDL